jgi:SulP family sulfate permease
VPTLPPGVHVFELFGSLFFGAVGKIEALPAQCPPARVRWYWRCIAAAARQLRARRAPTAASHAEEAGIGLVLAHVNEQPLALIRRSGFVAVLGDEAIVPSVAGAFDPVPR